MNTKRTPETEGRSAGTPRQGLSALPSAAARGLAFAAVIVAGLAGAVIGYGVVKVSCTGTCTTEKGVGALIGALITAVGTAVLAVLVLRAMGEWRSLDRPLPPPSAPTKPRSDR